MFEKISKIKAIKHLNAQLKEAKLCARYTQATQEYDEAEKKVENFQRYRVTKEQALTQNIIGDVVSLGDIDLMNEKLNGLRTTEVDLQTAARQYRQAQAQAYEQWQQGRKVLMQAQKAVDKFDYINDLQGHKEKAKQQQQEDLELEEFKPIKTLEQVSL